MVTDTRFDTAHWGADAASSSASTSLVKDSRKAQHRSQAGGDDGEENEEDGDEWDEDEDEGGQGEDDGEDDDFGDEDEEKDEDGDGDEQSDGKIVQPLSKSELEAYQRKQRKKGIIYISSIPHGMTPPKVRHLLGGFGDIERIYLHDGTQGKFGSEQSKRRSSAHYTEGWVEFAKKRVAKQVAEILNAEPIGTALIAAGVKAPRGSGAAGSSSKNAGEARRWKDHVWTMKYLPGFKWNMLTEQMAAERASRTARLRTELAQSALEQKDYLRKVERARIMREKEARREQRRPTSDQKLPTQQQQFQQDASTSASDAGRDGNRVRTFKQRAPLLTDVRDQERQAQREQGGKRARAEESEKKSKKQKQDGPAPSGQGREALDSVLGSIF
ncbi:RNA-binding ATPase activator esf2 [Tilletia horrida]|nr:RNA-binding ATPase activator esf2 [Tilletia horrida]